MALRQVFGQGPLPAKKPALPEELPLRTFEVFGHLQELLETVEGHTITTGQAGELVIQHVVAGSREFTVRIFAPGTWATVKSHPYTREQVQEQYDLNWAAMEKQQAEQAQLGAHALPPNFFDPEVN